MIIRHGISWIDVMIMIGMYANWSPGYDILWVCYFVMMYFCQLHMSVINTMRLRQNGRHFADDIFKCIFLNENIRISIKISLKFVLKDPINNIPALVQIMARRRPGDKPLSEPMMVSLLTHICITRPQRVKAVLMSDETSNAVQCHYKHAIKNIE